jgi:hypothetical protein
MPDMPPAPPPDLRDDRFDVESERDGPRAQDGPRQPSQKTQARRDPWGALAKALNDLGGSAAILAKAQARLDKGTLTLSLPGGRKLAEGRRAAKNNPAVVEAVHRYYSDQTSLEVIPLPGTGSDRDRQDALERMVLADPDMQRILRALDAQLDRVVPLTDDNGD